MFTENNDWLAPTLVAVGVVLVFVCTAILIVLWRIMQIMQITNVTRHACIEVSVGMIKTNREQLNICYKGKKIWSTWLASYKYKIDFKSL